MQPDTNHDIPTIKDIQYLIEELDAITTRRPKHDSALPFVLFSSKKQPELARQIVAGYRNRLQDAHKSWLVPHAFISQQSLASIKDNDHALLDTISDQLQDYMPKGLGKLRVTNYCAIRAILKMNLEHSELDFDEQQASVRTMLYKRYLDKRPWLQWLQGGLAQIDLSSESLRSWFSVSVTITLKLIARPLIWLLYGRHLAIGRRYRWFNDQIAELGFGANNFLSSAVNLAHVSHDPRNAVAIQRVLLSALLQDLERAIKPSAWSIRRARRTTPFIVIFESIAAGKGPARRFLEALAEVRNEFPGNGLLVIGAMEGKLPAIPGIKSVENFEDAARQLALTKHSAAPRDRQAIAVDIDAHGSAEDSSAKWWLFSHRVALPKRSFKDLQKPMLNAAALVSICAGIGLWAWSAQATKQVIADSPECSYVTKSTTDKNNVTTTEHVGIVGDKPELQCSFSSKLADIEDQIAEQNAKVKGNGFGTVVFVGPLDVPRDASGNPESGRQNQSGLWQLQGVARAQKDLNEEAASKAGGEKMQLKVLLANTGDQLKYAPEVTKQVGEFANDPDMAKKWHVMGVAGISQSRKAARDMIETFNSTYNLPVIGSTLTADNMINAGTASYMIAAPNSRQAAIAAAFAKNEPITGDNDALQAARNAVIITDDDDEYAYNLASDFRNSFSDGDHSILKIFNNPADGQDDPSLPDSSLYNETTHALQEKAKPEVIASQLCSRELGFDPQRDIIFYAARSQEFDDLLYALQHTPGCSTAVTVLGGSDLSQFRDYAKYPIIKDHFYFASFASSLNPDNSQLVAKPILESYKKTYGAKTINESDFARAYDATTAFGMIANNLASDDNAVSKETVKTYLSGTTPLEFAGVSGYIKLAGPGKLRLPPNKPVLIMKAENDNKEPSVHMSCGWFSSYKDASYGANYWGNENGDSDQFSCPQENDNL